MGSVWGGRINLGGFVSSTKKCWRYKRRSASNRGMRRIKERGECGRKGRAVPPFSLLSLIPLFITPPPSLGVFTVSDLLVFPCLCEGSTVLSRALAAASVSSHLHPPPSIDPSLSVYLHLARPPHCFPSFFSPSEWNPALLFQACPSSSTLSLCFSLTSGVSRPPPSETLHSSLKFSPSPPSLFPSIPPSAEAWHQIDHVFVFFLMFGLWRRRPCLLSSSDLAQASLFPSSHYCWHE